MSNHFNKSTNVTKATHRDIKSMLDLNYRIYPEEWHVSEEYVSEIMTRNPEVYNVLNTDKGTKGIVSFFPFEKKIYEAILQGTIGEKNLSPFILDYSTAKEVYIYLISIIVDIQDPHKKDYSREIIRSIPSELRRLEEKGIKIKEIGAIAISPDGEKILPKIGFTQDSITHEYPVFRASVEDILTAIKI